LTQASNRAAATKANIDLLAALDGVCLAGGEPLFNFGQIPNHAPGRQRETAWKLAALLHPKDGAVGQRDYFLELMPTDHSRQPIRMTVVHRNSSRSRKTSMNRKESSI
jgi:hypothetical protein